ncbi:iron-containing alcohol dehydrogenase [Periweissella cryptocerci]|uniref:Iron-containing alcohol dehydrogenase n=1 Tax=Periweissella cryptocerci TaxID=2506420 RepID=A0A4P6YVM0_9LACO|nr:iron-containing alcohol dehydrogenase [Periweissella cryptocerci]QBO36793.1 iron-containing alcohol dehydrogenase [Periweissella cryptocerci]
MENFRFYVPTDIRFGKDQLDALHDSVAQFGNNVLFIYGGGSIKKSGLYDQVLAQLAGLNVTELSGVEPNPRIESVREAVKLSHENNIDVILAVGGGSVIDAAKVAAAGAKYEGDAWDLVKDASKVGEALPLVDILTLSATGTEMNRNAVITNFDTNEKLGTTGWNLIPAVSFLNPENTFTVSKWQTAAGSADIMSHLFEQYFDRAEGTDIQDFVAEGILKTVIKNAPIAMQDPTNYDARANLMWASSLALNGLTGKGKKNGWTVHPIEHELSAYYDITHGAGLAALTPRWMEFALDATTVDKFAQYGENVWGIKNDDKMKTAKEAILATHDFFASLDIPMTLQGLGIEEDTKFAEMAAEAVRIDALDKNAYAKMTPADVEALYRATSEEFSIDL